MMRPPSVGGHLSLKPTLSLRARTRGTASGIGQTWMEPELFLNLLARLVATLDQVSGGRQGRASGGVVARVADHVGMGCAPDVALRLGQANELLDHPQPRAVADHVRMAGELEDAALLIGRLELAPEHIEHIRRRRV